MSKLSAEDILFGERFELPACVVDLRVGDLNYCLLCAAPFPAFAAHAIVQMDIEGRRGFAHRDCLDEFMAVEAEKSARRLADPIGQCACCKLEIPESSLKACVCKRCHRKKYNS